MNNCPNCGSQLQDDDQFCTCCGARRNTPQSNTNAGQNSQPVNTAGIGEYFKEILSVVIGILTKPASTIRYAAKGFKRESSFILAGIMVLVQSLLGMWSIRNVMGGVRNALTNAMGMFGGMLGGFNISYGKIFFTTLISMVIMLATLSGVVFLMGKYAFKGQGSFFSIWNVVVCGFVPYVALGFAGIILSYLSAAIGQVVIAAGILVFILLLFIGTMESMGVGDDKTVFILATSVMIIFLVLFIFIRIYISSKMRAINI